MVKRPRRLARYDFLISSLAGAVPDKCLLWPYGKWFGTTYGIVALGDARNGRVHRVAYEHAIGPIPAGMSVCHRCDTPACYNPHHLFVGAHRDNMRDMAEKGRIKGRTGIANSSAKLTEDQVRQIRLLRGKKSQTAIAAMFGITQMNVCYIQRHQSWKHVT